MRKCRIKFVSSSKYFNLAIDEEKNICLFNNNNIELDINNLLKRIERIISNWKQADKIDGIVLDGVLLEVYFLDNNQLLQLKYNDLSLPSNAYQLYSLLEELNG